jgi:hypothetical protein
MRLIGRLMQKSVRAFCISSQRKAWFSPAPKISELELVDFAESSMTRDNRVPQGVLRHRVGGAALAATFLLVGQLAVAHHSFAMFDLDKDVTIEGTVKEFQWTNPHVWIQVLVTDSAGKQQEWSIEAGAPGMLTRTGWRSTMLAPGDKISLIVHPARSGAPTASLVKVTLADGRVMGPGGPPPPPPASVVQ